MYGWTDFRVRKGRQLIVMLGGGDKSTQERDIRVAHQRATWLIEGDQTMKQRRVKTSELPEFDVSKYLNDEASIAEYLTMVIEEDDPALLAATLGDIAKARGMTEIAKSTGLAREALYKALRADAQPRFDTVSKVCAALGVKLVAEPA